MAEVAGLILGVIGVSGLFSACIESFDIVVSGKNFSDDFEQLCALVSCLFSVNLKPRLLVDQHPWSKQRGCHIDKSFLEPTLILFVPKFSLQRARFGLWGESVGLIPSPNGQRLQYDINLDRPDINHGVERILHNIKALLDEAGEVDGRYKSQNEEVPGSELSDSRGIVIFKSSFDRWKSRILKHQKETSTWKVARWALHDGQKFEDLINRLEKFVDGLESITKSLGLLADQHARLQSEIESISDIPSLKLLRDASSIRLLATEENSDTLSRRFICEVAESILEQKTIASSLSGPKTLNTFITARTREDTLKYSLRSEDLLVPGTWPKSLISNLESKHEDVVNIEDTDLQVPRARRGASRALEVLTKAYARAELNGGAVMETEINNIGDDMSIGDTETTAAEIQSEDIPQHQRLMRKILESSHPRISSFAAGDTRYGETLAATKRQDESIWHGCNANLVLQAHSGSSAAKRMFVELRNIRLSKVPFISAVPLEDSLDKVLASIEGPPETPYEGGVFFITVKLSQDSQKAPLMRFQTKIYHPNISPQGSICADYEQRWSATTARNSRAFLDKDPPNRWYRREPGETVWSLGALLTALCGLLATPDVDDPLVPEIAQKYIEDYDDYCRSAKIYTERYALPLRPGDDELVFEDDSEELGTHKTFYEPPSFSTRLETQTSTSHETSDQASVSTERNHPSRISLTDSLKSGFDESYPRDIHIPLMGMGTGTLPPRTRSMAREREL